MHGSRPRCSRLSSPAISSLRSSLDYPIDFSDQPKPIVVANFWPRNRIADFCWRGKVSRHAGSLMKGARDARAVGQVYFQTWIPKIDAQASLVTSSNHVLA
jgi:hypothetical protein